VETKGVYIQDVVLPEALVEVLSTREIAVQRRQTFAREQEAQVARIDVEKAKGTADQQAELARAQVNVDVQKNRAAARTAEGEGEASFTRITGQGEAARVEAVGLARAKAIEARGVAQAVGYEEQVKALGSAATALVAISQAVAEGRIKVVPDVLVTGGEGGGLDGLAATLMERLRPKAGDGARERLPERGARTTANVRRGGSRAARAPSPPPTAPEAPAAPPEPPPG
ncbi:MAG TPA: hypothetical protein VEO00_09330, partial [Actinomycetota bacterium]|nr:hypothetical protein [Actinomycetota bacterium]